MKRSTVNSSTRRTKKIITLMLIITVAVGLLPPASITVDAADYDLPYIIAITNNYNVPATTDVYVSDGQFIITTDESGTSDVIDADAMYAYNATSLLRIEYNDALSQWQTAEIMSVTDITKDVYRFGTSTKLTYYVGRGVVLQAPSRPADVYGSLSVVTNSPFNAAEQAILGGYSNDLTELPQGITEDAIRDIIDEQLNTMSASGNTATTIINNTTVQYNSYQAGSITREEMQSYVTDSIETLSDLTPSTLLDAMQINNALTYNQTIQDELLNTASSDVRSQVATILSAASDWLYRYRQGDQPQDIVQNQLRQRSVELNALIKDGVATTTADIEVVNAALQTVGNYIDIVAGYSDVEQDISDKSQQSDQAELDYLDELTAETTATVEELAPSQNFSSTQTGEAQEVFDLIWENDFVKKLLPMCAGFMVVCVVLGIRYKV